MRHYWAPAARGAAHVLAAAIAAAVVSKALAALGGLAWICFGIYLGSLLQAVLAPTTAAQPTRAQPPRRAQSTRSPAAEREGAPALADARAIAAAPIREGATLAVLRLPRAAADIAPLLDADIASARQHAACAALPFEPAQPPAPQGNIALPPLARRFPYRFASVAACYLRRVQAPVPGARAARAPR